MRKFIIRRLVVIIGLMVLLHAYIAWQLLLPLPHDFFIAGMMLLVLSVFMIPLGMISRFLFKNPHLSDILSWIGMLELGLFSSVLILTIIREVIIFVIGLFINISFTIWLDSSVLVILLAIVVTVIGFINARRTAKVNEVVIPIDNLPQALENFTIAQISDIHVGPTIKHGYINAIVERVNQLQADVVAVTGDLVDGSVTQLSSHTEPLSKLKSKYGSFFVLGNHEYYSGADSWVAEIKRLGLTVLLNQHIIINHDGENIVIAGVTDFSGEHFGDEHRSDPEGAISGAPDDAIKILLAHQPRSALLAEKYGFHLQLSGHTHGGQFWPWNLFVRFQQPFTAGLGRINNMWVYTNSGTGYWGPPKRFGVPSEITLIRIKTNKFN